MKGGVFPLLIRDDHAIGFSWRTVKLFVGCESCGPKIASSLAFELRTWVMPGRTFEMLVIVDNMLCVCVFKGGNQCRSTNYYTVLGDHHVED